MCDSKYHESFRRLAWEASVEFSRQNALSLCLYVIPLVISLGLMALSPQLRNVLTIAVGIGIAIFFAIVVYGWNYVKAAVDRARQLEEERKPRLELEFRDEIGTGYHQYETGTEIRPRSWAGSSVSPTVFGSAREWELDLFRMSVLNTGLETLHALRVELVDIEPKYEKLKLPLRLRFKGGVEDEFETRDLVANQPVYVDVVKQTRGLDMDNVIEVLHTEPKSDRAIPLADYKLKITAWGEEMKPETIRFQITSQRGRLKMWQIE